MAEATAATGDKSTQPSATSATPASTPTGETKAPEATGQTPTAGTKPATGETKPSATDTKPADETKPVEGTKPIEGKSDSGKPAETKPEDGKPIPATDGPPEAYDIKADGIEFDAAAITAVTPALKAAGLTNAQATALITDYARFQLAAVERKNTADAEALKTHPDLGGERFNESFAAINRFLVTYATPAERAALTKIGMVNDPNLVSIFARAGMDTAESPETPTGRIPPRQTTRLQRMYGDGSRDRVRSGPSPAEAAAQRR